MRKFMASNLIFKNGSLKAKGKKKEASVRKRNFLAVLFFCRRKFEKVSQQRFPKIWIPTFFFPLRLLTQHAHN